METVCDIDQDLGEKLSFGLVAGGIRVTSDGLKSLKHAKSQM